MLSFPPVIHRLPIGLGTCPELVFHWLVATSSTNDCCPPQMLLGKKPNGQVGKRGRKDKTFRGDMAS